MIRPSLLIVLISVLVAAAHGGEAAAVDRAALIQQVARGGDSVWRKVETLSPELSSRELFACALAWCEAGVHAERIGKLLDTAALMQDHDPASKGYGNFRWSWKDAVVYDRNAVEFSMRGGALLWIRHRDKLDAPVRDKLRAILELGGEGCRRYKVRENYSNIALMNAGNLILLGEGLDKPELAGEGYRRLERVLLYTSQIGIHEFSSPTYYGVDLDDLGLIEAYARKEAARQQARAMLELWWQDIALNFFPPAERYAGPNSRSYDYLHGLGELDPRLFLNGWIGGKAPASLDTIYALLCRWQPAASLHEQSAARFPRTVRQSWGADWYQSRTHYVAKDITFGTSAGAYGGRMDFNLTADFPGPRTAARCYFTSDGRGDPYGKKKIAEGPAAESHQKALHLNPFWAAAQQDGQALALAVYRPGDVPPDAPLLESHIVMPITPEGVYLGERHLTFAADGAETYPVEPGTAVILRHGTAALGVRVAWSNGAPVSLVRDAGQSEAVRLTVNHRAAGASTTPPGVLFHVRAGSGLVDDKSFEIWRHAFATAAVKVMADDQGVHASCDAGLELAAAAPYEAPAKLIPLPTRAVLELDGKEIGRDILLKAEPLHSAKPLAAAPLIEVMPNGEAGWEAESGQVLPFMETAADPLASGGKYVWLPGEPHSRGTADIGHVLWRLHVRTAGTYYLHGRFLTPTPDDDSFFLHVFAADKAILSKIQWSPGVFTNWTWAPLRDAKSHKPLPLELPAGEVSIELIPREDGAKLDRLWLTRDPAGKARE